MKEDQLNHRRRRRHRLYPPAMPHYYFHVRDEAGLVPDDEGSYFIDLAAARIVAVEPIFSDTLTLDLKTVEASIAGPKRPQDRIPLSRLKESWQKALPALKAAAEGRAK